MARLRLWLGLRARAGGALEVLPQLFGFAKVVKLFQRLVFDLADPLAGEAERPPDLVERPRLLGGEPVAQLEHTPLAVAELRQRVPEGFLGEDFGGLLVRRRGLFVGDDWPNSDSSPSPTGFSSDTGACAERLSESTSSGSMP